jgi:DNA polymerase III subunit delta
VNYDNIIRDINNNIFSPIYFLSGDEPYFIDHIVSLLENTILDEGLKGFNQTVIYGRDITVKEIIDLSRRYPMMGNYQVVIVKEAQYLNKIEDFESYITDPLNTTILIIAYKHKKVDKRKSFYKKMSSSKSTIVYNAEKLKDYAIPKWIESVIKEKGFSISPVALMLMSEYLGNDLGKITNEIDKLVININSDTLITEDEIEKNIGISKDYNLFELQNSLVSKDHLKAFRIVEYFESNPKDHPLQMITVMLHNYFMKIFLYHNIRNNDQNKIASELGIPPFFVKDYVNAARSFPPQKIKQIISSIRILDLKSKGVGNLNATGYGELKELVFKILN